MSETKTKQRVSTRKPKIVISEATLWHIEALAEGALRRNPALADRLLDELARARIVPEHKLPKNVVSIGNKVTYRDEMSGAEKTVTLVYPEQADIAAGRVSVMTPIGVALLGLAEGAAFFWDALDGKRHGLTVLSVVPAEAVPA